MRYFNVMVLIGVPLWYLTVIVWAILATPTRPGHTHNIECFTRVFQDERVVSHLKAVAVGMVWTVGAYGAGYRGCKVLASESERHHCSDYGTIAGAGTATVLMLVGRHVNTLESWIEKATGSAVFREDNVMILESGNLLQQQLEL